MKALVLLAALAASTSTLAQVSPLKDHKFTDLPNMDKAMQVWSSMKYNSLQGSSECFNRAHTWAYDMQKEFGIDSRKILIHFSYKYNKELSSMWGYHIAPLLSVGGVDMVFDRKYFDKPVPVPEWQAWFLRYATSKLEKKRAKIVKELKENRRLIKKREIDGAGLFESSPATLREENLELEKELRYLQVSEDKPASINCENITHIEQVDYRPHNQWCYIQKVSMYYWGYPQLRMLNYGVLNNKIPHKSDLVRAREAGARYETHQWNMDQVWAAREEAFKDLEKLWPTEYYYYKKSR